MRQKKNTYCSLPGNYLDLLVFFLILRYSALDIATIIFSSFLGLSLALLQYINFVFSKYSTLAPTNQLLKGNYENSFFANDFSDILPKNVSGFAKFAQFSKKLLFLFFRGKNVLERFAVMIWVNFIRISYWNQFGIQYCMRRGLAHYRTQ